MLFSPLQLKRQLKSGRCSTMSGATTADLDNYLNQMPGADRAKMATAMDYLSKERIENIFEKLTSELLLHKPSDHTTFLVETLKYMRKDAHERKRYEMQQILADLQAVKPAFIIMRTAFDKLDADKDNHVTADEFEKLIKELGFPPNPEVIQQVFAEADTNDDGGISFKEFLSSIYLWSIVSELQTATGEKIELIDAVKAVHRAFDFFDLDHSGYIDCDEFKRTMTMLDSPMTDEQKEEAYARVDGNGNGLITFKEYLGEIAEALGKTV